MVVSAKKKMVTAERSQKYSESQLFLQANGDFVVDFVRRRATTLLRPMVAKWGDGRQEIIDDICQEVLCRVFKSFWYWDLESTEDPLAVLERILLYVLKEAIKEWRRSVGAPDEDLFASSEEYYQYQASIRRAAAQILNIWWPRCSSYIRIQKPTPPILYPPPQKKKQRRQHRLGVVIVPQKLSSEDFSHSLNTQKMTFIDHSVVREKDVYVRGIDAPNRAAGRKAAKQ